MSKPHVQFNSEIDNKNSISIEELVDNQYKLHLGILKSYRRYRIEVKIPTSYKYERLEGIVEDPMKINILEYCSEAKEIQFEFEVTTDTCLQRDKILLRDELGQVITIILNASILGAGKGTPALKDGIHLIEKLPEPDSD